MLNINKYVKTSIEDLREDLSDNSDVFGVTTDSIQELAKQWNVEESVVADQVRKGIEVEHEHKLDD